MGRPGILLLFISSLLACRGKVPATQETAGNSHARCFSIEGDSLLRVRNVPESKEFPYRYRQGMLRPGGSRVVCLSSVITSMFDALGLSDAIIGVDDTAFITSPILQNKIAAGKIRSYAPGGQVLFEQLVAAAPDAVFWYTMDQGNAEVCRRLEMAGIPVIMVQSFAEPHPLGRSEWLRFTGRLFGLGKLSDSIFNTIRKDYAAQVADSLPQLKRPSVLVNAPFSGSWNLPASDSYLGILIRDAGGDYIWGNRSGSGTFSLQLEAVFQRAAGADVWINCNDYRSRGELLAEDPRFGLIQAFQKGRVFAANRGSRRGGGLPFWEEGSIRPDKVLHDLRIVFAADTARYAAMHYYRVLP